MRISPSLVPMLVVALVVLALYWPLMYLANIPVAQRALDTGAALPCQTAFECATQLRSPVLPSPQQLWNGFGNLMFPLNSPNAIPINAAVTASRRWWVCCWRRRWLLFCDWDGGLEGL